MESDLKRFPPCDGKSSQVIQSSRPGLRWKFRTSISLERIGQVPKLTQTRFKSAPIPSSLGSSDGKPDTEQEGTREFLYAMLNGSAGGYG